MSGKFHEDPRIDGILYLPGSPEFEQTWRDICRLALEYALLLCRAVDNREYETEDIAQEALSRISVLDPERIRVIKSLKAFLYAVVRNCFLDGLKRRPRETMYEDLVHGDGGDEDGGCFLDHVMARDCRTQNRPGACLEIEEVLEQVLSEVSKEQSEIFRLYLQGCKYERIAELTGYSSGGVAATINRIRQRIREGLDPGE